MVDEQNMKAEHWWNETNRTKPRNSEKRQDVVSTCLFAPDSPKFNKISDEDRHCSETEFLMLVAIKMTTLRIVTPCNPPR